MRKIFLSLIIVLLSISVLYAKEKEEAFTLYKDSYFIAGDDDDQVKYQFSFKYALFWPFEKTLYMGYTQTALWNLYDKSSPFTNYDHNPELFFTYGDLSFIKGGIEHKSNGRDGIENRSMNDYYIQCGYQTDSQYSVGIQLKVMNYFNLSSDNEDIADYNGYGYIETFFVLKNKGEYLDNEKIYVRFSNKWIESGIEFRILTDKVQPHFFIQFYHGYCESLLGYNQKDTAIRAGLIFR